MKPEAEQAPPRDAAPPEDWRDWLLRDSRGAIRASLYNLCMILEKDVYLQPIRLNELTHGVELTGTVPWRRAEDGGAAWRDADDANLMHYVEAMYAPFPMQMFAPALSRAVDKRRFHPVREYVKSIREWDGVPRAETLLCDYLGAKDTPYVRAVTVKMLLAALWRVFRPGIKFDQILVLAGPQGIGKSTLISRLGMQWYSDSLTVSDMNDKTAAEKLQGSWIMEIGELAGMRKADLEKVKSFLSRQDDRYRESYGRRVKTHLRQCVFFGTTNNNEGYLRDLTGNRRFWHVSCTGKSPKKPWELDEQTVKQIWAEAVCRCDEPLTLPPELEREAERQQRENMEKDDREGLVRNYLDTRIPEDWHRRSFTERVSWFLTPALARSAGEKLCRRDAVSNLEIWCECFGKPRQELDGLHSRQITAIMASIEGWERKGQIQQDPVYGRQRVYERIPDPEDKLQQHR